MFGSFNLSAKIAIKCLAGAADVSVINGEGKKQQGGEERRMEIPAVSWQLNGRNFLI